MLCACFHVHVLVLFVYVGNWVSKVVSDMKSKRDDPKSDVKLYLYSAVRMHIYICTCTVHKILNFGNCYIPFQLLLFFEYSSHYTYSVHCTKRDSLVLKLCPSTQFCM